MIKTIDYTTEPLGAARQLLRNRADRLIKLIDLDAPPCLIDEELKMIDDAAILFRDNER